MNSFEKTLSDDILTQIIRARPSTLKWPTIRLRDYKVPFAVVISIALHVLFLLALFLPPKPTLMASLGSTGQGDIDGAGFDVSLVAAQVAPRAMESDAFEPSPQALPIKELAEAIELDPPMITTEASQAIPTPSPVKPDGPPSASDTTTAKSGTGTTSGGGATGQKGQASGDLWGAVAPCWNKMANKNALGVTLRLAFTDTGGLSKPPEIMRDPSAPITEQSLKSEAAAIAALAACAAYPMVKGQDNVEVKFPAAS